jgi:hypothetical membrane protein
MGARCTFNLVKSVPGGKVAAKVSILASGFRDRHPLLGPAIWILSTLYFFAQLAVAWVWNPPYSLVHNTISDLGNTACGRYGSSYVCSPRHTLMNIAFVLLGLAMAAGSLFIYQEFTEKRPAERVAALIGFALMGFAGLGTMLVGIFPENTVSAMHVTGAGLAIGAGNVAIFVLGLILTLPEEMRRYMLLFSTLSLTALFCFAFHRYFGIGAGTMERVAAYPETVWLIIFGLYISRNHQRPVPGRLIGSRPVHVSSS